MPVARNDPEALRQVTVEVQPPSASHGVVSWWDADAVLRIELDSKPEPIAVISGNAAGLTSLARQLLTLAQSDVPRQSHMDFDTYFGLFDEGSAALRLERD
jgi:hypothetical protein